MTIREEYENLKLELVAALEDASVMSVIECPFGYNITSEMNDNFFKYGSYLRQDTQRAMVLIENSYQKSRLFPGDETADLFIEAMEQIISDFRENAQNAYKDDPFYFADYSPAKFNQTLENFINDIKEASKPYVEKIRTTTQHEIELEVKARDNYRKQMYSSNFDLNEVGQQSTTRRTRKK